MPELAIDYGSLEHLLPPSWEDQVRAWLAEDTRAFDYGGFVVGDAERTATLWGKSAGILAGKPFVDQVFAQLGCRVEWHVREGSHIETHAIDSDSPGRVRIATVSGPVRKLL